MTSVFFARTQKRLFVTTEIGPNPTAAIHVRYSFRCRFERVARSVPGNASSKNTRTRARAARSSRESERPVADRSVTENVRHGTTRSRGKPSGPIRFAPSSRAVRPGTARERHRRRDSGPSPRRRTPTRKRGTRRRPGSRRRPGRSPGPLLRPPSSLRFDRNPRTSRPVVRGSTAGSPLLWWRAPRAGTNTGGCTPQLRTREKATFKRRTVNVSLRGSVFEKRYHVLTLFAFTVVRYVTIYDVIRVYRFYVLL